jgi:hypothetical protein
MPLPNWVKKTWKDGRTTLEKLEDLANKFYQLLSAETKLNQLLGGTCIHTSVFGYERMLTNRRQWYYFFSK